MLNRREIIAASGASTVALLASSPAAATTQGLLAPELIQSDLALLQDIYQSLHPGLYRYNTPAQIIAHFREASRQFEQPAPLAKVYLTFSKLLARIKCGHSYANFYSQSNDVKAQLFEGKNRLPFKFVWIGEHIVVTDPAAIQGLPRGTRIHRINGVSTGEIGETLRAYVRADGNNIGKQMSLLSVNRDEGFQTFDIFYALHYGSQTRFALEGITPARQRLSVTVDAIDLPQRLNMTKSLPVEATAPRWQLNIRPDKIAVMTMPTWGLYNTSWDWKAWLATSFAAINTASCKGLIIDIRGNEGGRDDCGPEILGYLTPTDLAPQAGARRVAYRKIPDRLNPYLDTWDDSFRDWGDKAVARGDRLFDLVDQAGRSGGAITPKATNFSGKVCVLSDATNSSATLQFCQLLRANRLGTIIGATTGGNQRGINAEKFMFARLPKTGLEVDVPLVGFFPVGTPSDGGLRPDLVVEPTWLTIGNGSDPVLERALLVAR